MNRLSVLALATAALAVGAEAQAQTREGWRLLNWPAKRDQAASAAAAQPLVMGAPRESRYSPRRAAPTTTRTVVAPASSALAYQPPVTTARPVASPAPATVARTQPAPQRLPRPVHEAAAAVVARQSPRPAERPAAKPASPVVQARATQPAAPAPTTVDPAWAVREELMSHIPPAPTKAQASLTPAAKQPKAAFAPAQTAKTEVKPGASAKAASAKGVKTAAAPVAAPVEPWRTRTAENGPRFYSLHRQFGVTPDQTRASTPTGAAADPLPSAFFLAGVPADKDEEENASEDARREAVAEARQQEAKKKKGGRRK